MIENVRKSNTINRYVLDKVAEFNLDVKLFVKDMKIRWNSTYLMLKRLLRLEKIYESLTKEPENIDRLKV